MEERMFGGPNLALPDVFPHPLKGNQSAQGGLRPLMGFRVPEGEVRLRLRCLGTPTVKGQREGTGAVAKRPKDGALRVRAVTAVPVCHMCGRDASGSHASALTKWRVAATSSKSGPRATHSERRVFVALVAIFSDLKGGGHITL